MQGITVDAVLRRGAAGDGRPPGQPASAGGGRVEGRRWVGCPGSGAAWSLLSVASVAQPVCVGAFARRAAVADERGLRAGHLAAGLASGLRPRLRLWLAGPRDHGVGGAVAGVVATGDGDARHGPAPGRHRRGAGRRRKHQQRDDGRPVGWPRAVSAALGILQYLGFSERFTPWMNVAAAGEAYGNLRQPNLYASLCWIGVAVVLWGGLRLPFPLRAVLVALLAAGSAASAVAHRPAAGGGHRGAGVRCGAARRGASGCCSAGSPWPPTSPPRCCCRWRCRRSAEVEPTRTLWGRLGGGDGCSSRLVLWANVLDLIALKPVTGWGWGELDYAHFMHALSGRALLRHPGQRAQPAAAPGGGTRRAGGAADCGAAIVWALARAGRGASAIRRGSWPGPCSRSSRCTACSNIRSGTGRSSWPSGAALGWLLAARTAADAVGPAAGAAAAAAPACCCWRPRTPPGTTTA